VNRDLNQLRQIADELRCLPDVYLVEDNRQLVSRGQQDNLPSWMQTAFLTIEDAELCALEAHAGNLIVKAFNLGAFRSPAHALLRGCIGRQQEPPDRDSDEWQSWGGAVWRNAIRCLLPLAPDNTPDLDFSQACRLIARVLDAEIKRMELAQVTDPLAAKTEKGEGNGGTGSGRPAPKGEIMDAYRAAKSLVENLSVLSGIGDSLTAPPSPVVVETFYKAHGWLLTAVGALADALWPALAELTKTAAANNEGVVSACGVSGANAHDVIYRIGDGLVVGLLCALGAEAGSAMPPIRE